MPFRFRRLLPAPALAGLVLLAGCINLEPVVDPTETFLLNAPGINVADWETTRSTISLYVDRVEIPPYLDDRRLVVRASSSKVEYDEFARWAEPLDQGVARAVALNLLSLPGVDDVGYYPWKQDDPRAILLRLKIFRFERDPAGTIQLNGLASVGRSGDDAPPEPKVPFQISLPVDGDSPAAIVEGMSRSLNRLSVALAEAYRQKE